jgi:alkaline phosphatase
VRTCTCDTPRRLVGVLALALFALAGVHATTQARADASSPSARTPKRLIFFLSDGMGPAHLTLARDSGACGDALVLDDHLVGASRTRSTDSLVTDSAAGATAYATGHRTYNHVVGEVPEGADRDVDFTGEGRGVQNGQNATSSRRPIRPAGTIVEGAQLAGMRTGVVTTTRVTHATPASFSSHVADRDDENEIALEQVYSLDLNVILGGGASRFLGKDAFPARSARDDARDLMADAEHRGYAIARDAGSLRETVAEMVAEESSGERSRGGNASAAPFAKRQFGPRVLGLFADSHLAYEIDGLAGDGLAGFRNGATPSREDFEAPSLVTMLDAALAVLDARFAEHDNDEGFFLLVEAGRVDHAAHANDAGAVVGEICAYDRAFKRAVEYVASRDDALVVATSDHDTGGVSVGCCDVYGTNVAKLVALRRSAEFVANDVVARMLATGDVAFWSAGSPTHNATVTDAVRAIAVASLAAAGRDVSDESDAIGAADLSAIAAAAIEAVAAGDSATHTYEGYALQNLLGEVMNRANGVGWTSRAHTGVDVPVFAHGVGAEAFRGSHDNFRVGQMMIDALGVDPAEGYKTFKDRLSFVDADPHS